jgi:DNA-directed RNA polymerase specialized sigma54-like protein
MNKIDLTEKLKEELMKRNLFEQDDEDEDDDESDNKEEESSNHNEDFCEMACQILHSQKQAHIFHLGTKSFAEHMALNG